MNRTWQMRLSDAWFYAKHPITWYREIYRQWRAGRVGQIVFEM